MLKVWVRFPCFVQYYNTNSYYWPSGIWGVLSQLLWKHKMVWEIWGGWRDFEIQVLQPGTAGQGSRLTEVPTTSFKARVTSWDLLYLLTRKLRFESWRLGCTQHLSDVHSQRSVNSALLSVQTWVLHGSVLLCSLEVPAFFCCVELLKSPLFGKRWGFPQCEIHHGCISRSGTVWGILLHPQRMQRQIYVQQYWLKCIDVNIITW